MQKHIRLRKAARTEARRLAFGPQSNKVQEITIRDLPTLEAYALQRFHITERLRDSGYDDETIVAFMQIADRISRMCADGEVRSYVQMKGAVHAN